ncbi:pyridoxal phosphate-dependent aminotransferase [Chelatococcus asaccharovorans]|uniref:pyridoxal phosphate-dependent aminotransferase n=1 Tax=Chelatococcus asaccharovorans TaxID=28210 RepID=UPI00224C7748|nr:histidinol-phosphate transaminase [Chelatococcus asaccharovorans]CAH1650349.1 Histidinol-phosphate aminotransferase [Chelatococcus asaccharovorans]CAH1692216.1 Histidinol-phosphate aminotransferase [Chelatococcus asaccharovorans]
MTLNPRNAEFASVRLYEAETSVATIAARHGLDPAAILDFSLNVNPFGPPPAAIAAAQAALATSNLYPDLRFARLRQAVALRHDVPEDWLFFGAGLDDVIKLVIHAWTTEGCTVLVHVPTFPRYELEANLRGCRVVAVESPSPEKTDLAAFDAALAREAVALAFICSPNNPTGENFAIEAIADLATRHADTIFVVDEALINPAEDGAMALPKRLSNVVVLRTFSKYFGLAGLRIGCAVADPHLVAVAEVGRPPFNIAAPSVEAAVAALADEAFLASCKQTFTAEKDFFIAAMEATPGISIRGSNANMILMDLAHHAPAAAAEALAAKGLVVADATSFRGLENHRALRVSLRGRADNERLVAAIKAIA